MFVVRNDAGRLRYSMFSTPSVVTRLVKDVDRSQTVKHPFMVLNGCDGRRYLVNTSNGDAKVV